MAWNRTYTINGKKFGLFGWGRDVSLQFDKEQIKAAGQDLQAIIDWYVENGDEIGIVELWRETNYDDQFFSDAERQTIMRSKFANDDDRAALINRPKLPRYEKPIRNTKRHGHIYLIKAETSPPTYKIGKAKDLDARTKCLGVLMPFQTTLVHTIEVDDTAKAEQALHARFADKRINGEWFSLSDTDIESIKTIDAMW